nr:MAG TPA: hypothetical protein [Caudoviricetes sp.]
MLKLYKRFQKNAKKLVGRLDLFKASKYIWITIYLNHNCCAALQL